jgi:hypothetical protein
MNVVEAKIRISYSEGGLFITLTLPTDMWDNLKSQLDIGASPTINWTDTTGISSDDVKEVFFTFVVEDL